MRYRVRADMSFEDPDDAEGAMTDCKKWVPRAVNVNVGEPWEEQGFAVLEKCFHDVGEGRPCEVIERVEVVEPEE